MFERNLSAALRLAAAVLIGLALCGPVMGQEASRAAGGERSPVPISFLPPPLETATFSVGIYDAKTRKLVRHLHEGAAAGAFTVGLNGLITSWDGKDDSGKPVPPGKYAARGYAVGDLKVEGKAILGNDWAADNEALRISRVEAIALVPEDNGLVVLGATPSTAVLHMARYGGVRCELLWQEPAKYTPEKADLFSLTMQGDTVLARNGRWHAAYRLADGAETPPAPNYPGVDLLSGVVQHGKDGTVWKIEEGVLAQYSATGERLRSLAPKEGEPTPVAVAASKTADLLYLLEESKDVQRVQGLSWKESAKEGDKAVSIWNTFFERSIRSAFTPTGADGAALTAQTELALVENPLSPGRPERLKLAATFDARGSYLATADGLRLRQISQRPNLRAVKLGKSKANPLLFYQSDGAAWDEFAIDGAREMMGFDAGEFELTATGEKPAEKPAEPDL